MPQRTRSNATATASVIPSGTDCQSSSSPEAKAKEGIPPAMPLRPDGYASNLLVREHFLAFSDSYYQRIIRGPDEIAANGARTDCDAQFGSSCDRFDVIPT